MSRPRGPVLCLDLAPGSAAGVVVDHGRVERWFVQDLLPGSLPAGAASDPSRLAAQLRSGLERAGISVRRSRLSIPDSALLSRAVRLPAMSRRELRSAAVYAVERAIPIPPRDAAVGWTASGSNGTRTLMILAGWRDVVDKIREAASGAGLAVESIEPRSTALSSLLPERAVILELAGSFLQATASAPGASPFTGQAPLPRDAVAWPAAAESLVTAARRHLGAAGRDLTVFMTTEVAVAAGGTLDARRLEHARLRGPALPDALPLDRYLAAVGLGQGRRRVPSLVESAPPLQAVRGRVRRMRAPWAPALLGVSAVSWSAVAAGAALLLGWHPSWPLAP